MSWLTNIEAALASGSTSVVAEAGALLNSTSSQANGFLTTIVTNYTDASVVADQVMKLKEVKNLPAGAAALATALPAACAAATADPTKISNMTGIVAQIKALL